ncbi:hypothetical protein NQ176_g3240 [Zarea fungicola]|uniref:Uncharacterized protein n=1 Tax=Zarea fungicola TaxID=93591 RepID=A0ACC1NKJ4_9HYPO|nr:hypothetical protein NQ176_g3240 [Lecanicillium fungicola]
MNPAQPQEVDDESINFPPAALSRIAWTTWPDSRNDPPWKLATSTPRVVMEDLYGLVSRGSSIHENVGQHLPWQAMCDMCFSGRRTPDYYSAIKTPRLSILRAAKNAANGG